MTTDGTDQTNGSHKGRPGLIKTPNDELTHKLIGMAMTVHNEIGPGMPEEFYQKAVAILMRSDGLQMDWEYPVTVSFREQIIGVFRLDIVVEKKVVFELKAVAALAPIHEQQVLSYLAASGFPVARLVNFGAARLEFRRLFPSLTVQNSVAFKARQTKSQ